MLAAAVSLLGLVGEIPDGAAATTSGTDEPVTVQVDNTSDAFNYESTSYFPTKLTAAAGTTVEFHSNFRGEPHTVALGSSIDKGLKIYDTLTPKQQNGPPPKSIQKLKIPFVVPDDADFSDPGAVELNQSAAQPCYLSAGETAPGAAPCPEVTQPEFDGTQPLYNSGILKDDQVFKVTLSDKLEPGTYQYFCLFHGPEMRGTINVVAPGAKAPSAAAVEAAGNKQLNATVKKIQPALAKADAKAKPGTVQSGVGVDGVNAEAVEFAPTDVSIPVGGSVTWNLSFHTVSFNFPESARPDIIQDADDTWHFNGETFTAAGFTPNDPPKKPKKGKQPAPYNVDAGTWNGSGYLSSGSFDYEGDVTFKVTFATAGTYTYTCLIHPDMEGTVKVG